MGDILQFRPKGKEGDLVPIQRSAEQPQNVPISITDAEDVGIDLDASRIHVPTWQDLFNDEVVTFRGSPVAVYRESLDVSTLDGRNQRVQLENALIMARAAFIGEFTRVDRTIKFQAQVRLGKEAFQLGLELGEDEPLDLGRDILVAAIGSSSAARVIENMRVRHRIRSK